MNDVFSLVVQYVYREEVVGQQHGVALAYIPLCILILLLDKHAAPFTVHVAPGRFRAYYFFCFVSCIRWWDFHDFLGSGYGGFASKHQGVGDLPKELTPVAYAWILRIKLHAWVRAFDLRQFPMHAVFIVRVQIGQPHSGLVAIITLLRNAQPPTPQRLHAIVLGVLGVVLELSASIARLGLDQDVLELGDAVLEQLHCRCRHRSYRPFTRDRQVCLALGRQHGRQRLQLTADVLGQCVEVKGVAFSQYANLARRAVLLFVIERIGHAQHSGGVCCHGHVDAQGFLLAQALEVLRHRLPLIDCYILCERPVAVQPTTRTDNVG